MIIMIVYCTTNALGGNWYTVVLAARSNDDDIACMIGPPLKRPEETATVELSDGL